MEEILHPEKEKQEDKKDEEEKEDGPEEEPKDLLEAEMVEKEKNKSNQDKK